MINDKKIDYKIVNLAILALIVYLMYHTGNLWIGIFNKFIAIIKPFVIGFAIAYSVYPITLKLRKRGLPKSLAIFIVIITLIFLFIFMGYIISTTCVSQISALFNSVSEFVSELSSFNLKINIRSLQEMLNENFKSILDGLTKYVSDGAINLVSSSIEFIGIFLISMAAFIYFLIDMDKIRSGVKTFISKRNKKTYEFIKLLDNEMRNYLGGLIQVMIISVFEYGISYLIIGHPNAIVLGLMAGIATLIPYFGGIATNIVAAITAFIVSPALFVRTVITFFLLSSLDSYIINPHVYGKTNSIPPLATIFALFAGGILFGLLGVFISFPLAIFVFSLFKFYKDDISSGIEKIKSNNKKDAKI